MSRAKGGKMRKRNTLNCCLHGNGVREDTVCVKAKPHSIECAAPVHMTRGNNGAAAAVALGAASCTNKESSQLGFS